MEGYITCGRFNVLKMSVLHKLIYRFSANPIKVLKQYFLCKLTTDCKNGNGNAKNQEQ